ncbi:MAG: hypothetical protein EZS28_052813, partial [Streblomastix strix]
ECQGNSTQGG